MSDNKGSWPKPEKGLQKPTLPTPWLRMEAEATLKREMERMLVAEAEERYMRRIVFRTRALYEFGWTVFALLITIALCFLGGAYGWRF